MCGIAGLIGDSSRDRAQERVRAALVCLRHRGPDGHGLLTLDAEGQGELRANDVLRPLQPMPAQTHGIVVLGNQRLSIIDLSPEAGQPMATDDGRYVLSFNGEIYNYLELRSVLEGIGERFRTRSDTEVLLRGFARWGLDVLQRVEGMYAFALVDRVASTLVLARDCFGMKPLYYAVTPREFAFASEIPALLQLAGIRAHADPAGLLDFLTTGVTDHRADTMFTGIKQLPAAHYLELSLSTRNAPQPIRYWTPDLSRVDHRSQAELIRDFRDLFFESIARAPAQRCSCRYAALRRSRFVGHCGRDA